MPKMPLRVPPPPGATVVEQWLIDSIVHLDDCLDELKRDTKTDLTELKAEVASYMAAGKTEDASLSNRIDEHKRFHELMEARDAGRSSVWRSQWTWLTGGVAAGASIMAVIAEIISLGVF